MLCRIDYVLFMQDVRLRFLYLYTFISLLSLRLGLCIRILTFPVPSHTFCFLYFDFSGTRFLRVYHSAYYYSQDKKLVSFVIHLLPLCVHTAHWINRVEQSMVAHWRCHIFISASDCLYWGCCCCCCCWCHELKWHTLPTLVCVARTYLWNYCHYYI